MKGIAAFKPRQALTSLVIALALLMALLPAQVSLAQGGEQPGFVAATYSSPDGGSTIQSQEAQMAADFLVRNGTLEGVALTPGGIGVAEGQASGTFTSGVVSSPLASTTDIVPTWSADVPAGSQLRIQTRLSKDGGSTWSDWMDNPVAFFPVRDNQYGGSLIWVGGGAASLQFRVILQRDASGASPMFRSLTVAFSNTAQGPSDAAIASQMAAAEVPAPGICPAPKPPIVPRTMWGNPDGEFSPRRPPEYAPVTHIIIHHSATPNYPGQDWGQVVRSIWNYHANILWWGDVGYNYLIDPNGLIYEGRAGGDDVVGIHDNFNRGSMAIGYIGCYGNCGYLGLADAEPSPQMLESSIGLMAWKVGQKGLDPKAVTVYDGAGVVPVIAGGRDVTATFSPGDYLYNKLPWLRDTVAQRASCTAGCQIKDIIFDKPSYALGDTIHLTVKVIDQTGNPVSGAAVTATVAKEVMPAEPASPFPLYDLTGYYQGTYTQTNVAGTYRFDITATDPTGARFAPCSASQAVSIGGALPPGAGPLVKVEPEHLVASWCSYVEHTAININNAVHVRSVALEVTYDPRIVQVADADPVQWGVQVNPGGAFITQPASITRNEVDTDYGHIYFEASMIGSQLIEGNAGLILIDWRPRAGGTTSITLAKAQVTPDGGQALAATVQNGDVEIRLDCISGSVVLQGRSDYSGVIITSASGAQAQTDASGRFTVSGGEPITARLGGYLSAVAAPGTAAAHAAAVGDISATNVGSITLLAGDLNGDDVVNIFDLALIAGMLDTSDAKADLNGDGVVNILDVALIASNYGQQGPLTSWK
jgi:hypothetical protein